MINLGIVAGGGALPRAVAGEARRAGRNVFVAALRGSAEGDIGEFPHAWLSLGEAGKLLRLLREHGCSEVLFAGRIARPDFSQLRTDAKGLSLLPRVVAAARLGDDALLRTLMDILAGEGFSPVGIADVAPGLLVGEGVLGRVQPEPEHESDILRGVQVVRGLGTFDVGRAAIVCAGLVLAVEAVEGTDAMIARVAALPQNLRGSSGRPRGVLVKALKTTQDGKTDLPVVGLQTVENAARAHLAGIAAEAGRALVLDRSALVDAADRAKLFLLGFPAPPPAMTATRWR